MPLLDSTRTHGRGAWRGNFRAGLVAFGAASNADRDVWRGQHESSIEYLRPGRVGPLMAEARAVRIGAILPIMMMQIFDGEGALIARAIDRAILTMFPCRASDCCHSAGKGQYIKRNLADMNTR